MEDMFKDVPEAVVKVAEEKYKRYEAAAKEPVLTFEEYTVKLYRLYFLNKQSEYKQKELIELKAEIKGIDKELEELNSILYENEAEELLADFNKVYEIIFNDSSLSHEEKLDKLKAYYYTVVRNIAKEVKFLNNLNGLIKEQDSEGFNDVLLIDFYDFVKVHYD